MSNDFNGVLMSWQGKERRKVNIDLNGIKEDISNIRTDIELLIRQVENNHKSLRESSDRNLELLKKHDKTLYGNGDIGLTGKINDIKDLRSDLKDHSTNDRNAYIGIFTILISILLGIGKLVFIK